MMRTSSLERVRAAYRRLAEADRPEVWIHLRDQADAEADAARVDAGQRELPLRGTVVAVKDNIDVAGMPTTGGFPAASRVADEDAPAVARLRAAGAVVIGKTNLDQFATGLVGTRSPYGAVRNALWPERISGGSSSGSAVAVALGIVDLALGTDTAGSGRVPAALNELVGIKPSLGLVPATGMMPACRPYDTITVFGPDLATAVHGARIMTGPDAADPLSRAWPADVRLAVGPAPVLAIPDEAGLAALDPDARRAWERSVERLSGFARLGAIDVSPLLGAAKLLYEGAMVAGRFAAAGAFVAADDPRLDPTVAGIVRGAAGPRAWEYVRDRAALDALGIVAAQTLEGCDALVLPTAPAHPTIAEVNADPVRLNARMGTYTNFVNLLDFAAVAVPAGRLDAGAFGITVVARAFQDQVAVDVAARFLGVDAPRYVEDGIELAVFGAHLRGQPLNHQLVAAGARFLGETSTSAEYRLFRLDTVPPKPGLVKVAAGGAAVRGERWALSAAELGRFLAALPEPMTLGEISLADGRRVVGFGCAPAALAEAEDITVHGGWLAYLASRDG